MSTHNICFYRELEKNYPRIIVKYSPVSSLTYLYETFLLHLQNIIFCLFLNKNMYCGHSLEASFQSASNEY